VRAPLLPASAHDHFFDAKSSFFGNPLLALALILVCVQHLECPNHALMLPLPHDMVNTGPSRLLPFDETFPGGQCSDQTAVHPC